MSIWMRGQRGWLGKKGQEFDEMNIATFRTHEVFIKLLSVLGQISRIHLLVPHFERNSHLI